MMCTCVAGFEFVLTGMHTDSPDWDRATGINVKPWNNMYNKYEFECNLCAGTRASSGKILT